ncbi:hypothetical protein HYW67_01545 [Candidatus Parcubacteria bacterium]|nr:hypothetical protein [Candidatus Parcubacteria bacterium]
MARRNLLLGTVLACLVGAAAAPAFAINIEMSAGATIQVEPWNTLYGLRITISPVTILSPNVPGYPPGTYAVRFEWNPLANVLMPISATPVGGGGGSTGGHVGVELNGVVIEAESLTPGYFSGCLLQLRVRNRTGQLKSIGFTFNAFNAAGTGIGFTIASGIVSANGVVTLEGGWAGLSGTLLSCSQIARYELDRSISYAYP